jgi:hypothetical protein
MSSFVNTGLLWGLGLLALPILIHLINLMRQRRVHWAAMEFLLVSKKKNNTWIKLKELILLLLRLAAVAAVVLILAQPLLQNQWARLFGDVKTNHVILLDDSYSMSDRWGDTTAFEQAKGMIERLGAQSSRQPTPQTFTILRFSQAQPGAAGAQYDLNREKVDSKFETSLADRLKVLQPSQSAVGLEPALAAATKLIPEMAGEDTVLYVVSDFRARDWEDPVAVAEQLEKLNDKVADVHLVNCVDTARMNVSITALAPLGGTRAANVPVPMSVTVKNFGSTPVENVDVLLAEDGRERPSITIDQIAPGKSETRRFEVFFPTAGSHQVTAKLPPGDAVQTDNERFALVDLPLSVPVLLIDGDDDSKSARFLDAVFQPGGQVRTGLQPQIERPEYLNNHALEKYRTIYLADIDRLDSTAITALENYTKNGGSVVFFIGPKTQSKFFNEKLYRNGEGLFPAPLLRETQLLVDRLEKGSDIETSDQGVFQIFAGERNSYLAGVTVEKYYSVPKAWTTKPDPGSHVLAKLRNGDPLVVEREFGKGRVVAMLSTASPEWNNWSRNPSFIVALLELQSYLGGTNRPDESRVVGTPIKLELDAAQYQPKVRLLSPGVGEGGSVTHDATVSPAGLNVTLNETGASGLYELQLATIDNNSESRHYAFNVEPDEGDLAVTSRDHLTDRLQKVRFNFRQADDFQVTPRELAGANLSDWILYALIAILVGEQLLAYSASYHPKAKEVAR